MAQKQVKKDQEEMIEIPRREYNQVISILEKVKETKEDDLGRRLKERAKEIGKKIEKRGAEPGLPTREERAKVADKFLRET